MCHGLSGRRGRGFSLFSLNGLSPACPGQERERQFQEEVIMNETQEGITKAAAEAA